MLVGSATAPPPTLIVGSTGTGIMYRTALSRLTAYHDSAPRTASRPQAAPARSSAVQSIEARQAGEGGRIHGRARRFGPLHAFHGNADSESDQFQSMLCGSHLTGAPPSIVGGTGTLRASVPGTTDPLDLRFAWPCELKSEKHRWVPSTPPPVSIVGSTGTSTAPVPALDGSCSRSPIM
jgi:hypothetical protein